MARVRISVPEKDAEEVRAYAAYYFPYKSLSQALKEEGRKPIRAGKPCVPNPHFLTMVKEEHRRITGLPEGEEWWTTGAGLYRGAGPGGAVGTVSWEGVQEVTFKVEFLPAQLLYYCVDTPDLGKGVSSSPIADREWLQRTEQFGALVVFESAEGDYLHYVQNRFLPFLKGKGNLRFAIAKKPYEMLRASDDLGVLGFLMPVRLRDVGGARCPFPLCRELAEEAGLLERRQPPAKVLTFQRVKDGPEIPLPRNRAERTLEKMGLWPIAA